MSRGDAVALASVRAMGALVAALPLGVALFLVVAAWPALSSAGPLAFTSATWAPRDGAFGLLPMLAGTLVSSALAVALAAPLGLAHAAWMRMFAPPWLRAVAGGAVALLAGLPSVVFGLVALLEGVPRLLVVAPPGLGLFTSVVVLAAMVVPTVAATADAAFEQVDPALTAAARALGVGRWDTLAHVVFPAARGPIGTGVRLALVRAMGETMAVSMVAGNTIAWPTDPFRPFRTLTTHVAGEMAYATGLHRSALFVAGLVLLGAATALVAGRTASAGAWPVGPALGTPRTRDAAAALGLAAGPLAVFGTVAGITTVLAVRGAGGLSAALLTTAPSDAGRAGGLAPFLVATAWVWGLAMAVAVPVGLATALWLAEAPPGRAHGLARQSLDVLAAVPSIVFGLFGLAVFCEGLGLGWSVLAGALTVAGMLLPLFVRSADEALRAVPAELRTAGAALGLPRWVVVWRLVLPEAAPLLGAGTLLATGRVLAESAALMFTAGGSIHTPTGPLQPGRVLAYHVYQLAIEVPGGLPRACTTALVLVALVWAAGVASRAAPAALFRRAR